MATIPLHYDPAYPLKGNQLKPIDYDDCSDDMKDRIDKDECVKTTSSDPTSNYLNNKVRVAGILEKSVYTDGDGNEQLLLNAIETGKIKINNIDQIANYLEQKLINGDGINLDVQQIGSTGEYRIAVESLGMVAVSENDDRIEYLENKLVAGDGIAITKQFPGLIESLKISTTKKWLKRNIPLTFNFMGAGVYQAVVTNFPLVGYYHIDVFTQLIDIKNVVATLLAGGSGDALSPLDISTHLTVDYNGLLPDHSMCYCSGGALSGDVACAQQRYHWINSLQGSKIVYVVGNNVVDRSVTIQVSGLPVVATIPVTGYMDVHYLEDVEGEFAE